MYDRPFGTDIYECVLRRCKKEGTPLHSYYGDSFHRISCYYAGKDDADYNKEVIDRFYSDDGMFDIFALKGAYGVPYVLYRYSQKYLLLKQLED